MNHFIFTLLPILFCFSWCILKIVYFKRKIIYCLFLAFGKLVFE